MPIIDNSTTLGNGTSGVALSPPHSNAEPPIIPEKIFQVDSHEEGIKDKNAGDKVKEVSSKDVSEIKEKVKEVSSKDVSEIKEKVKEVSSKDVSEIKEKVKEVSSKDVSEIKEKVKEVIQRTYQR